MRRTHFGKTDDKPQRENSIPGLWRWQTDALSVLVSVVWLRSGDSDSQVSCLPPEASIPVWLVLRITAVPCLVHARCPVSTSFSSPPFNFYFFRENSLFWGVSVFLSPPSSWGLP